MQIARIMGVVQATQNNPNPTSINESSLGVSFSNGASIPPLGIFFVGTTPYVVDTGASRILQYDPFTQWPLEVNAFSPPARKVFGQPDFQSSTPNQGLPQPADYTFSLPTSAVLVGNDLIVADGGNNRVIAIPQVGGLFLHANRVVGQVDFKYGSLNLIEGRDFDFADVQHPGVAAGVAIDTVSSVPHLYVADVFNNRILGFNDARSVQPGQRADLVIGQPDFFTAEINYPSGDAQHANAAGLYYPEGVAVDKNGDLWVADSGNGRVVRFPRPFDQGQKTLETANLALGKPALISVSVPDASSQNMAAPYAIAFTVDGHVVVSDPALNRVVWFRKPAGGDFVTGQTAANVFGQPDLNTTANPDPSTRLNTPRGIALDGSDRLYIADSGNNRVTVYSRLPGAPTNPQPVLVLRTFNNGDGLTNPIGITVDQMTQELWVADSGNSSGRIVRFPQFDTLVTNNVSNLILTTGVPPLAINLDAYGNPVVADEANRVALFYRVIGANSGNAANYFARWAPGMLATIKPSQNSTFGSVTATFSQAPLPTTLGDVQVFVNGVAAPLLYVSPTQINFQVPSSTPTGSFSEVDVVQASTKQVLAGNIYRFDPYSPGLFTADASGTGQLAVLNQDNTPNTASAPARANSVIQMFGTGEGIVPGGPPDGAVAPSAIPTPITPRVFINGKETTVSYSGLAPGYVGLWQINATVPSDVPPGVVNVVVTYADVNSAQNSTGAFISTTIHTTP
jgi:uncharacterized protein (TIGR03437 family)